MWYTNSVAYWQRQSTSCLPPPLNQLQVPQDCTANLGPSQGMTWSYNTPKRYLLQALYLNQNRCWPEDKNVRQLQEQVEISSPRLVSSVSLLTISRTFNSLFKVLFIFPSRYLFAIGLSPIFSFRWYLPPILGCIPKQPDSLKAYHIGSKSDQIRDSHPLWCPVPRNFNQTRTRKHFL